MDDALGHEITQLLQAWRRGDEGALDKLTPQVYRELHLAAKRCMSGERDGHTLQTTALINELYLRLSDLKLIDWQNRAHFFALCARQMRRILTDQARARRSHKRGDGVKAISLDDVLAISGGTFHRFGRCRRCSQSAGEGVCPCVHGLGGCFTTR
jgi:RNA polymerase sigma factor (TIGR02999 family)